MDLEALRRDYGVGRLERSDLDADPVRQFGRWLEQAIEAGVPEANALTLSTVGADGRPSARILLLKRYGADGLVFATNFESRKGREIAANDAVAMTFFWQPLERQVRIEGRARKASPAVSDALYNERPRSSRLGAWASEQSRPLRDREALEQRVDDLTREHADREVPRPDFWGGYVVDPDRFEFWQGGKSRLHDRWTYRKDADGAWSLQRLNP